MFDIHQSLYDEEYGEVDSQKLDQYVDDLREVFTASPEGREFFDKFGDRGFLNLYVEYAYHHFGTSLPELDVNDVSEILFDVFPRKVSTEPDSAPMIVAELRALFAFLDRAYSLPNAKKILDYLRPSVEERLQEKLADPANYGPAKSFAMAAMAAGVDVTDADQMNAFMAEYNSRILGRRVVADLPDEFGSPDASINSRGGYQPAASAAQRAAQRKAKRVREKNARRKSRQ